MTRFETIFLATLIPVVTASIFTSSHKMRQMALQEDRILSKLKEYIDELQDPPREILQAYMKLSWEFRQRSTSDIVNDLKHPNGAYYAIKRFSVHYPTILGTSLDLVNQRLRLDDDPITLADSNDFQGALVALIRLRHIYNLSPSDMIEGNYRGHMGPPLGYEDAYFVGRMAFIMSRLNTSRDFLEYSLELRLRDPMVAANPRREPTVSAIKSLIGRVYILLGNLKQAEELYRDAYEDDRNHGDVNLLATELRAPPVYDPPHVPEAEANYSRLCQYKGPYHIESPDYKAMKCRYKAALVPYYVFKEEILSISPYISLFYNVFTKQNRTHLMENVYGALVRCKTGSGIKYDKGHSTGSRTCHLAWLRDEKSPQTALLSMRVSLVTGMSVQTDPGLRTPEFPMSGEAFQIVNYGLAGHYTVHLDSPNVPDASGFRIATFLVYLNLVEEGGNTVFPKAGISVAPEKDTVLFWYNFSPSLDKADDLTHHAGCPVIKGEKWIANKWIRSHGNDYYRPCGLKPDSTQLDIEKVMAHNQRIMFTK